MKHLSIGFILGFLLVAVLGSISAEISMASERVHPYLYITASDVERAKSNIERYTWARKVFDTIISEADKWASLSDAELRERVPPPGSIYAYGFSSCPECHVSWPWWGAGGICDFSRPLKVKCPSCERIFPDERHPDNGEGWVDNNGKSYYFIGIYNSFAIQAITLRALDVLSNAYILTKDERYAHAASVLLDRIAEAYPTCTIGSIDYPGAPGGRFERTQYQVARVLVHFARYFDLLYDSPAMDAPSATGKASIRKAVEENVLRNGADYCLEQSKTGLYGLTNGQADFTRGVLAVGLVLGDDNYTNWALKGPQNVWNFLENNLDRDGQYFETSTGYADHALNLYIDMAEMLVNYRSPEYPEGINLYEHPKLSKALAYSELDMMCAGHKPRFGDSLPDVVKLEGDSKTFEPLSFMRVEYLYRRASSQKAKEEWAKLLNKMSNGDVEAARASLPNKTWLLFHAEPAPKVNVETSQPQRSNLLDGKGIAILRAGDGPKGSAVLLRYGPSVCHGHLDDLNVNFFALGRELTYDLGYVLGSAHVQKGWAHQTASHNLVVVNERSQMLEGLTGGSPHLFAEGNAIRMVEASAENSYKSEGVSLYRRTLALVGTNSECSYLADIFRVRGGDSHDLFWHAVGEKLTVEGAELSNLDSEGSLAGKEYDWGRRVGPDGDIIGVSGAKPYWNPPPGNGYGFLYDIRHGPIGKSCSASWVIDSKSQDMLKIYLAPPPGSEIVTATAPGVLPKFPKALFAIVRRKGDDLSSAFASVLQPYSGLNPGIDVERMAVKDDDGLPVGLHVDINNDIRDYILSSVNPAKEYEFSTNGEIVRLKGRFAFVRTKHGKLCEALLIGGTHVSVSGITITTGISEYWGRINSVDYENCQIETTRELPTDGSLVGQIIYIGRRDYNHKSAYRIKSVTRKGGRFIIQLDTDTLVLGKGFTSPDDEPGMHEVHNIVPLEKSASCIRTDTGYFRGKLIKGEDGRSSRIINVLAAGGKRTILVPDASVFSKGKSLVIYDIQDGDIFEIPSFVHIVRENKNLQAKCNTPAQVHIDAKDFPLDIGTFTFNL